ncbi:MAG: hypothetical protein LBK59_12515 [Bifidobacteriaceae bacterium]|jgi:hypothetical protein|nr:hypothetical protein [Bifidobacteriaceae bacterium]
MRFTSKTLTVAAATAIAALSVMVVPVAGAYSAVQVAPSPYTLTLTAPKSAATGEYVKVKAVVTTTRDAKRASLVTVELQRKIVGTSWTTVATDDTNKKGVAKFVLPFSSKTQFRARVAGTSTTKPVMSATRTTTIKSGTIVRSVVEAETAKCVASVTKYAKARSKADPSKGALKDPTAITSLVAWRYMTGAMDAAGTQWIKLDAGCGTTYKPDAYLASGGGSISIQKQIDGTWTEVVNFQQLTCDQADHMGIPVALAPVCALPDGTIRMPLP